MTGKNPHRPEGKSADAERAHTQRGSMRQNAERGLPSEKDLHNAGDPHPTRAPGEEEVGGSRPGVPSRVKDAIERIEDRAED